MMNSLGIGLYVAALDSRSNSWYYPFMVLEV